MSAVSQAGRLTDEQIAEFRGAFALYDLDGKCEIRLKDLGDVLRQLRQNPTAEQFQDMIKDVREKGHTTVTLPEFLEMMTRKANYPFSVEEVGDAFRVFDKDGKGLVRTDDLRHAMANLGERLSNEDVNDMMREADRDDTGTVMYDEFIKMMTEKIDTGCA